MTAGARVTSSQHRQTLPTAAGLFSLSLVLFVAGAPGGALRAQSQSTGRAVAADADPGFFAEPPALTRGIELYENYTQRPAEPRDGFYPELGGLITGSGWLSIGPGYRHGIADGKGRFSASGAVSLRLYNMAQARVEFPEIAGGRVALGVHALYRDSLQVNYFGPGPDAPESDRSGYRLRTTEITGDAATTIGAVRIGGRLGWIPQVKVSRMAGRTPDYPDTQTLFSDVRAPGLEHPASFLFAEITAGIDTRRSPGYPVDGGFYEVRWAGYSDRDADRYSFQRFELEASRYVPIRSHKWILAVDAWVVGTQTGENQAVPFYLLPSLGGKNTLRGYSDFRFHDRDVELFSVESRWALFSHVEAAVFADAGRVASHFGGLGLTDLERSIGGGLRVHTAQSTIGRLDVAHGPEGWHVIATMSGSFKRSTPNADRRAVVPFVP